LTYKNKHSASFIKNNIYSVCASFRFAAVDVLVAKSVRAAKKYDVKAIAVAGGVAANKLLRRMLADASEKNGFIYYQPEFEYCTDNAAMIARTGLEYLQHKIYSPQTLNAYPTLKLTSAKI